MYIICVLLGKLVARISRWLGNSGAALPGYVIERFYPRFLPLALSRLPAGVVVISGTNGKTTTTKLIADCLETLGIEAMTNRSGSNFVRSIISVVVDKSSLAGKLPFEIAILEQDEAYAARLAAIHPPRAAVVLNVMRDQMDRFGEIDKTAALLGKLTASASDFVVLNADDQRVAALPSGGERLFFGVSPGLRADFPGEDEEGRRSSDAPPPRVCLSAFDERQATYQTGAGRLVLTPRSAGQHNYLNIAAALTVLEALLPNRPLEEIARALESVPPAFGRGEELMIAGRHLRLQLVKNPGSFTQALKVLSEQPYDVIGIAINDNHADGRDVSWLWDVDFSPLYGRSGIVTGGTRAYDMALRLKYDGIKPVAVTDSDRRLLELMLERPGQHAILYCTYTAMWRLRRRLIRQGHARYVS